MANLKRTQSAVYVETAKKLPTTGMNSKASIVLSDYCSNYFCGISARKKKKILIKAIYCVMIVEVEMEKFNRFSPFCFPRVKVELYLEERD